HGAAAVRPPASQRCVGRASGRLPAPVRSPHRGAVLAIVAPLSEFDLSRHHASALAGAEYGCQHASEPHGSTLGRADLPVHQDTPANGGANPPQEGTSAYLMVWQLLYRRKGRILLAVVLALTLGTLYCAWSGPWYDSSAQLLVIKKRLETAPISGPDQARVQEDYLSAHMLLITSRCVIEEGIKKGKLRDLEQFRDQGGLGRELWSWVSQTVFGEKVESNAED